MNKRYLEPARVYLIGLSPAEQGFIASDIDALCSGRFSAVQTKKLRGPVRELVVGNHRLTYFVLGSVFYFVRGFRKKTAKTPKAEIKYAEKIYKIMRENV